MGLLHRMRRQARLMTIEPEVLDRVLAFMEDRPGVAQILADLDRSARTAGPFGPRASWQMWRETIFADYADGAQVLNTTTETGHIATAKIPVLPIGYLNTGRTMKWTLFFDISTVVTTPGNVTFRQRQNTVGGTAMATSGVLLPKTTVSTTLGGWIEYYTTMRTQGAAGTAMTMGRVFIGNSAFATTDLAMGVIPTSAPATAAIDTTATQVFLPTVQFSVATATTQLTNHIALLESMN